jgi:polar amino acid transport system permease protein
MNYEAIVKSLPYIMQGTLHTILLSVAVIALGTIGGIAAGLLRFTPWAPVRYAVGWLVEIVRAIPLLMLIFFIFFGFPALGLEIPVYPAAVLALSLWMTVNTSEVVRGGVQSIPVGQSEAARSTGLTGWQAMRYVIFPQALRRMIPPYVGLCTILIKDTSLTAIIGVLELTRTVQDMVALHKMPIELYLMAAAIYFCISYPLSLLAQHAEARLQRG